MESVQFIDYQRPSLVETVSFLQKFVDRKQQQGIELSSIKNHLFSPHDHAIQLSPEKDMAYSLCLDSLNEQLALGRVETIEANPASLEEVQHAKFLTHSEKRRKRRLEKAVSRFAKIEKSFAEKSTEEPPASSKKKATSSSKKRISEAPSSKKKSRTQ